MSRVSNPPNPWRTREVELLAPPPAVALEIFEESAASIVSENDSPDLGFRFSVNPYRGCYHACAYCYARTTHEYLDFGAGTDFDRKIVVKVNAPELLERTFESRPWRGDPIVFCGATDGYQPIEACYRSTRRLLEVCLRYRNPVGIITKGALIRRDTDLLANLARVARATVYVSLAFADPEMARCVEPTAPAPAARLNAIAALAEAGLDVGVALAPIIPGLNDGQIPEVLAAARAAGARRAFHSLLRLPGSVRAVFRERLAEQFPDRAGRVLDALRECRDDPSSEYQFGKRFRGSGSRWQVLDDLFHVSCRRLGIAPESIRSLQDSPPRAATFRRPCRQLELFDGE